MVTDTATLKKLILRKNNFVFSLLIGYDVKFSLLLKKKL